MVVREEEEGGWTLSRAGRGAGERARGRKRVFRNPQSGEVPSSSSMSSLEAVAEKRVSKFLTNLELDTRLDDG
jgi:hypothetical protein